MPLNIYRCDTCGLEIRLISLPGAFACVDCDCDGTMLPVDTRVAVDNRYRGDTTAEGAKDAPG